jgi:hypothetical protein
MRGSSKGKTLCSPERACANGPCQLLNIQVQPRLCCPRISRSRRVLPHGISRIVVRPAHQTGDWADLLSRPTRTQLPALQTKYRFTLW